MQRTVKLIEGDKLSQPAVAVLMKALAERDRKYYEPFAITAMSDEDKKNLFLTTNCTEGWNTFRTSYFGQYCEELTKRTCIL